MPTGHFIRTEEHKKNISKALKGKSRLWQRKEKIEKVCPCGAVFYLTPGQVREKHGKYCSRKCYFGYRLVFNVSHLSHLRKGDSHWNWKGDKAGYKAFHLRVNYMRGKAETCEECSSNSFVEWANLSGNYQDIYDYKPLCRKCHRKYDLSRKTPVGASTTICTAEGGGAAR